MPSPPHRPPHTCADRCAAFLLTPLYGTLPPPPAPFYSCSGSTARTWRHAAARLSATARSKSSRRCGRPSAHMRPAGQPASDT
eukprot:90662-Chlamydomonas_euryale.AAC.5